MMLMEHDAKLLLAQAGIPVPAGRLADSPEAAAMPTLAGPWMVKAQVPVGGRGKAGGIVTASDAQSLKAALAQLLGSSIRGHAVLDCRIEEAVRGSECYLSFTLNPAEGRIRVLASDRGGVDIEAHAANGALLSCDADYSVDALAKAVHALVEDFDEPVRSALRAAAQPLASAYFSLEATLLEINPLFVRADGTWVVGDSKLVVDDNALARQPRLTELVRARARAYPEIALKLAHGFDFVVLDPEGEVGLVTTGAGLSMQLIDEIVERGYRPFNFCDIRTGQFRGDPARLIQVLRWIADGPAVRSVLMNFFAGVTHLGELAQLLVFALKAVPELKVPITLRIIGNGYDEAMSILRAADNAVLVEPDLERALDACLEPLAKAPAGHRDLSPRPAT
jgi:succinyl-CoA synthetase beta subunit